MQECLPVTVAEQYIEIAAGWRLAKTNIDYDCLFYLSYAREPSSSPNKSHLKTNFAIILQAIIISRWQHRPHF